MVYVGESDNKSLQPNADPKYPRSQTLVHSVCDFMIGYLKNSNSTFICSGGPIAGRYVFVEAYKEDGLYLWLNEVEVRGICWGWSRLHAVQEGTYKVVTYGLQYVGLGEGVCKTVAYAIFRGSNSMIIHILV